MKFRDGSYKSINGTATFDGPSNVGKLNVEFPSTSGNIFIILKYS